MSSKAKRFIISLGSVLGAAAVNYSIIHSPFVFLLLAVIVAHELAHYFLANYYHGNPDYPFFIPIPFLLIGVTRIKNMKYLSFNSKKKIYMYGPITGFITALALALFSFIFYSNYTLPLLILALTELLFGYFGSDGAKYRKYSRQEKLSCIYL